MQLNTSTYDTSCTCLVHKLSLRDDLFGGILKLQNSACCCHSHTTYYFCQKSGGGFSPLSPHLSTPLDYTTKSLVRLHTNSWITYINDSDPQGYLIYSNCPFDYCYPQTEKVSFSLPDDVDAQCLYNRSGVLCGSCRDNLSLSLGSSRCLVCPTYWPVMFAVVTTASIVAGLLLVIVLLVLNITVTTGLINGIIFYANAVSTSSGIVFPVESFSFPRIIVAWLNLDIGFDICFFDGLDMYIKTWLQLAFPAYIIMLVVIVIKISKYSPRFTHLLDPGKRDPGSSYPCHTYLTVLCQASLNNYSSTIICCPPLS